MSNRPFKYDSIGDFIHNKLTGLVEKAYSTASLHVLSTCQPMTPSRQKDGVSHLTNVNSSVYLLL